jgi:hypothetical protein
MRGVHEDGGFEAGAEGLAEGGEARAIVSEVDGETHVVVGGGGDQFGEVEIAKDAEAAAGDGRGPGKRDEGDAHPESVEAGGVAAVGEGVEDDIDAMIEREVVGARAPFDEFEAIRSDARCGEEIGGALAVLAKAAEEEESGVWDLGEDTRPEAEDGVIDLREIVEAAEGEESLGVRREVVDGQFDAAGVVAPKAVEEMKARGRMQEAGGRMRRLGCAAR